MSFSSTITITGSTNVTNFDIYECPTSACTGCVAITGSTGENVSRMKLLTGHTVTVSQGYRYIKLVADTSTCNNSICMEVVGIPTFTLTPTPTGTPAPTATPTPTATSVPESTSTPTPTATSVPESTPTPTPTATNVPNTPTPTPTPTSTPTPTPTPTPNTEVQITNCVRLVKDDAITGTENCNLDRVQRHEVTLYDAAGANIQTATYDITVTLTGTDAGDPATWTLIIPTGQSSAYEDIITREFTGVCGDRDGQVTRFISGISAVSPTNIDVCDPAPTPTGGVTLNTFYYGQGLSTSDAHCGTNYSISASFFSTATIISELFNSTIYTTSAGTQAFNGLSLWYPVDLVSTSNTLSGGYNVIKINSNGYVEDLAFISSGCSVNPY